jgi:hypothetical protein
VPTFTAWMRQFRRRTVRPRSSVRVPVLVCALMFAITATVVNRWGRQHWTPVNRQTTYTATVLAIEKRTGATTPYTITDTDPRRAKSLASVLAERYAAERTAEWGRIADDKRRKARDLVEKTRQEYRGDAARLSAFEQQRNEGPSLADASRKLAAKPAMIDNPVWLDLQRQISDLERRRDQLLVDRTPLHPAVQEIEGRLTEVKQELAATVRQIPDARVRNGGSPDTPSIALPQIDEIAAKEHRQKLAELTASLGKSRLACQEAERAEQRANQESVAAPQFAFERPEAVQNPLQVDHGWRRLLWTTFASGLLMVFGIAVVSLGATIEPPLASVDEVEAALGESVLGAFPDDDLEPDVDAIGRQWQLRRTALAAGVILILACPVVAVWGVMGI